ncbi:hypothetical protein HK096_006432 [Nowakowskiella sp. JEL0078]|nr:hypothetical protein HK096_006432 [Nowakowskiella sp. JEL0078]
MLHLKGSFPGPIDTPYQGGIFIVDIKIPKDYPFKPPLMKFDTKIFHPNISSQTGANKLTNLNYSAICLDILKDHWTPVLTLKSTLISLQSLLADPAPDDPQDAEVAKLFINNHTKFIKTAQSWTRLYAMIGTDLDEFDEDLPKEAFKRLCEMGFERSVVAKALRKSCGNEERAIESLLSED